MMNTQTMKLTEIRKALALSALLFGAVSAVGADRFYTGALNIEPGETRAIEFVLENEQQYYGFQLDVTLPDGLSFVQENVKAAVSLSGRADNSYHLVSNQTDTNTLRLGTFSTTHTPFSGHEGVLMSIPVSAGDDFSGGMLSVTAIYFIDDEDNDVSFPEISLEVGAEHADRAYVPDFTIKAGESAVVPLNLDNDSEFTAFQVDFYLPSGLSISSEPGSWQLSGRASDHSLSIKDFQDGRVRVACFSPSSAAFSGNEGALLSLTVTADTALEGPAVLDLRNLFFSTPKGREYILPDAQTNITVEKTTSEPDVETTGATVRISHSTVIVDGVSPGCHIELYSTDGKIIGNACSDGTRLCLRCPGPGIYILRLGNERMKIAI